MSNLKKFEIVCNEGSLSGSGSMQPDITLVEWALDKDQAEKQFYSYEITKRYGRRIKSIREAKHGAGALSI
jgi:hypothetical protein